MSTELTSPEFERRLEILEQQMHDLYKQIQNLQSVQNRIRTALNELHTELGVDITRKIDRASQESIEISPVGFPFVVAGIVLGTWPPLWMNPWAVLVMIPLFMLIPTAIWWRDRKLRARRAIG